MTPTIHHSINRYTGPHGIDPRSVTAALAVNALFVAGLILAAPDILPKAPVNGPIIAYPVPLPTEPPPLPEPQPSPTPARPHSVERVATPDPVVPFERPDTPRLDITKFIPADPPLPPSPPGDGTGTGARPAPAAVFVSARPDPSRLSQFQPAYPASERRAEREGLVTVRVRIGTDGRVEAVERVDATSDAFFEATRKRALSTWRFTPATRGGTPVASWYRMTVRFVMQD